MMTIEFRNDLDVPIAIRFLVTKMGNFYVDIEKLEDASNDKHYSIISSHNYDIVELQPE